MPARNDTTSFAGHTQRDQRPKSNALRGGWSLLACLCGLGLACEDNPRVRTLDPAEAFDAAADMIADMAVDAAVDQAVDMAAAPCVVTVAAVGVDGEPGPGIDCDIAPPNACERLADCVCEALSVDDTAACVEGLTRPRALINLSDECTGQTGLDDVCSREFWQMSAPAKIAVHCTPGCADVPATLAER